MVATSISASQPLQVQCEPHGTSRTDVWLRKNITKTACDIAAGDIAAGVSVDVWMADELHFVADGTPTPSEIEADFNALWSAHEHDDDSLAKQVAAARQLAEDNAAALLELGDIIGGE